jgi:hypothetical protein
MKTRKISIKELKILVENIIKEDQLEEVYPQSFDMDVFKSLKTFKDRIAYCETHLSRISSGSSRIVYKIDDEKVLKLAKNKKGLAQNEVEIDFSSESVLEDVVANVFDYEQNYMWAEMELARPVTKNLFKQITGYDFNEDYYDGLEYYYFNELGNKRFHSVTKPNSYNDMWEDDFMYGIFQYLGNFDVPVGDLKKLSSYGVVKRNGVDKIVLIDYGLDKTVLTNYYS